GRPTRLRAGRRGGSAQARARSGTPSARRRHRASGPRRAELRGARSDLRRARSCARPNSGETRDSPEAGEAPPGGTWRLGPATRRSRLVSREGHLEERDLPRALRSELRSRHALQVGLRELHQRVAESGELVGGEIERTVAERGSVLPFATLRPSAREPVL